MTNIIKWDGTTITKPGIYSGIPINDYHKNPVLWDGECVSTSGIRAAGGDKGSALDYWAYCQYNEAAYEFKTSRVMTLGKAAHLAVLGDAPFGSQFIEAPESVLSKNGSTNTNAYREWKKLECDPHGLEPLKKSELKTVYIVAEKISKCSEAKALMGGLIEHTIVHQDEATGLWIRSRPDTLPMEGIVCDLKGTEADVSVRSMKNLTSDMNYHAQLAIIGEGMKSVTGHYPTHNSIVYAMLKEPYHVIPCELNETWIEDGRDIMRKGIDRIAHGFKTGEWPGRADTASATGIVNLEPPQYMVDRVKRRAAKAK